MSGEHLSPSFMGRCDLCGKPIDMEHAGDVLTIFHIPDELSDDVYEDYPDADQQFADAIARALESEYIEQHPYDWMLAGAIRDELGFKAHDRCLKESNFDLLTEPIDDE